MSFKLVKQDRDVLIVSVTIINTPSSQFVLRVASKLENLAKDWELTDMVRAFSKLKNKLRVEAPRRHQYA